MRLPFTKRPSHTMLWISNDLLARIDFLGSKNRIRIGRIEFLKLDREKTLQAAMTLAINLVSNRPGPVSIVSPSFWTDFLTLPADVVSIANPDELAQALALDAEIDSGVSAFESRIASKQFESNQNGDVQFCVTQASRTALDDLTQSLRSLGTSLQFVAHPLAFELLNANISYENVEAKLNSMKAELSFQNRDEEFCRQWLDGFATGILPWLSSRPKSRTLLLAPESTASPIGKIVASLTLASIVTFGCVAWNHQIRKHLKATTNQIARIEQQQKLRVETSNSVKKATAKLVQLRKEASDTEHLLNNAQRIRQKSIDLQVQRSMRWSLLVEALAEHAGDCWIQRIVADGSRTSVLGLAPSNSQAHEFAMRLERSLRETGWVVAPAITQLTSNGLYEFNISVRANEAFQDWKTETAPYQVVSSSANGTFYKKPHAKKNNERVSLASSEALR